MSLEARQQALLAHGPAMLDMLRSASPVEFAWIPGYADYYPEAEGGMAGGRTIEPVPFDGRILGDDLDSLNPPYLAEAPADVSITAAEYRWLSLGTEGIRRRCSRRLWSPGGRPRGSCCSRGRSALVWLLRPGCGPG